MSGVILNTTFCQAISDFFSGLNSGQIKLPDTQMNVGPLPSIAGGPAGSNGDPDGKINFNNNLLDGITPYAYGQSARMGSDRNYQQIPHRVQQIINVLYLPTADNSDLISMSHAVDQGDVAFTLTSHRPQGILFDRTQQLDGAIANSTMPNRTAFCNLATVNYLLAGLQRHGNASFMDVPNSGKRENRPWVRLAQDLNYSSTNPDTCQEILRMLRMHIIPYGICAGSENQGGKHETGYSPIQAAVNHVTTMTVDGQNRDLVNFWRAYSLDSGDELIYRLEKLPVKGFTLNHYYKGTVHQTFPGSEFKAWQLVPDVYRMTYDPAKDCNGRQRDVDAIKYDYRIHGYWRVGQMFHHRQKNDMSVENYSNDTVFLRGSLLHVTFAPVWVQHEDMPKHCPPCPLRQSNSTTAQAGKRKATHSSGTTPSSGMIGFGFTGLKGNTAANSSIPNLDLFQTSSKTHNSANRTFSLSATNATNTQQPPVLNGVRSAIPVSATSISTSHVDSTNVPTNIVATDMSIPSIQTNATEDMSERDKPAKKKVKVKAKAPSE